MLLSTNNRDARRIRLVAHSDRKLAERVYRDRQRIRGAKSAWVKQSRPCWNARPVTVHP